MSLHRKILVVFKNCLFTPLSSSACANTPETGKAEACDSYFFLTESEEIDAHTF